MRFAQENDISVAWSRFLMKVVGVWLAENEREQRNRKYALIYTLQALAVSTFIAIRDLYYSCQINFSNCVYISSNLSFLIIDYVKIAVIYAHRAEFYDLIKFTQNNFWRARYRNVDEQLTVDTCRRLCMVFVATLSFTIQGTCMGYMLTPLIANIGKNQSDRILPFNMWVDYPLGLSPYFEVLFTLQIVGVYYVGMCYVCFDNILCIISLHTAAQFSILQRRLTDFTSEIAQEINAVSSEAMSAANVKLKRHIRQHQMLTEYCWKLERIFSLIVLGQVLFLSVCLCLLGYQLLLMDIPTTRNVSVTLHIIAVFCQLYMLTYSCDLLIRQSTDVGNAIYSSQWPELPMNKIGNNLRRNVMMIILRSRKPSCLTASGFFPVSLETYTSVLSTALSCFTLLRKTTMDL